MKERILEKAVKKAVKKRLDELGAFHHWPVQGGYGSPILDCIGCLDGFYFAVETKRPGEVPTALQDITAAQIRAAGGLVFVVDSLEKARDLFSDRLPRHRARPGAPQR